MVSREGVKFPDFNVFEVLTFSEGKKKGKNSLFCVLLFYFVVFVFVFSFCFCFVCFWLVFILLISFYLDHLKIGLSASMMYMSHD